MKVIALIDDVDVTERILKHFGIRAPRQNALQYERPPPERPPPRGGPQTGAVPDIA